MKTILVTGGTGFIGNCFCKLLLEERPEYKVINVDVCTYAANPSTIEEELKNPNYKFYKTDIRDREAIEKIFEEEKPDIVISFCNKANFRASLSMVGINIPLLVSVRNDPKMDYAPYALMTSIMSKRANGCVFQTNTAKAWFSGKLQGKSKIIINPIDDRYINVEYAGRDDVDRIATVGRISKQKNQLLILQAMDSLREKYPKLVLEIYGSDFGDGTKEILDRYIVEHNLTERVKFMGVCDNLETRLQGAIFVLSSDYEGMPNALMEAMAIGMPVVATDCPCGGPRDLIRDGNNGFLFDVGDARELAGSLNILLSDKDKRLSLGMAAMKIRKQADSKTIYSQWKEYITEIIR